jgi:hypothetical protein
MDAIAPGKIFDPIVTTVSDLGEAASPTFFVRWPQSNPSTPLPTMT